MGGNIIFIEEAAFTPDTLFKEIIAPTLVQKDTCLVAFSTVSYSPEHFFGRLIANKNEAFTVHRVKYICEVCETKKQDKTKKIAACIHNIDLVPHWNTASALNDISELVGSEGMTTFMVENLGLDPERPFTEVFPSDLIKAFINAERVKLTRAIRHIFYVVDPCSGSTKAFRDRPSDFAVIAIGSPGNIILGIESIPANKSEHYTGRIIESITKIKSNPYCKNATIVVDVESGNSLTTGDVYKLIEENFNPVVSMCDFDGSDKPGTKTTYESKSEMAQLTKVALTQGTLSIHENWVTTHDDPAEIIGMLHDQLCTYTRKIKELKDGDISITYSGKEKGKKDDLAVTFQRAIRAMHVFFKDNKYAGAWR